jgi:hypothetical protein
VEETKKAGPEKQELAHGRRVARIHLPLYLYVSSPARLLLGGLPVFLGWNQICFHDAVLRDAHGDWPDFSCEKKCIR